MEATREPWSALFVAVVIWDPYSRGTIGFMSMVQRSYSQHGG